MSGHHASGPLREALLSTLPGYSLKEELCRSQRTLVYRAVSDANGESVVVKTTGGEHPLPRDVARLRHEHRLLRDLDVDGAVRTRGLERLGGTVALLFEDSSGQSLDRQFPRGTAMPVDLLLDMAIGVARTLARLHGQLIHKDVNPRNIVWHPQSRSTELIDFGLSAEVSRERPTIGMEGRLEGSLPFISPEQTGRMNRALDYRTDLYSLGVTLYQLLTGELPFEAADPLGWIHQHMTRAPRPPPRRAALRSGAAVGHRPQADGEGA